MNFIKHVCLPCYTTLSDIFPETVELTEGAKWVHFQISNQTVETSDILLSETASSKKKCRWEFTQIANVKSISFLSWIKGFNLPGGNIIELSNSGGNFLLYPLNFADVTWSYGKEWWQVNLHNCGSQRDQYPNKRTNRHGLYGRPSPISPRCFTEHKSVSVTKTLLKI